MKKLVIAVLAVTVAVIAEAATVSWKTGANVLAPDGVTKLGKDAYTMYVWDNLTSSQYAALTDSAAVYEAYKDATASAKSASSGSAALGTTVKNASATDSTTYYAAIILAYTDGDSKEWYIANKATVTTDATGGGASITNLGKNWLGSGSALTWTAVGGGSSVPEPTSGLLMLLGVAGLALRRRRA